MGGIALAVWNHPRATRDVDILVAIERSNVELLIRHLARHSFRPKHQPPLLTISDHSFVQLLYTPPGEFYDVQLDLLLAESDLQKAAVARRVQRNVPGISQPIDVVQCEDLLLFKMIAGRIIDLADAAMLIRENRDGLSFTYLGDWVTRLSLAPVIQQVWQEAFPEETCPICPP